MRVPGIESFSIFNPSPPMYGSKIQIPSSTSLLLSYAIINNYVCVCVYKEDSPPPSFFLKKMDVDRCQTNKNSPTTTKPNEGGKKSEGFLKIIKKSTVL